MNTDGMNNQDVNQKTFLFMLSWVFTIFALTMIAKSRLGYTIIYYALLLIILFITVTEYQTLAPIFGSLQTPLALDQSTASATSAGSVGTQNIQAI